MREKIAELIYVECNQLSPAGEECLCDRPIEAANKILFLIATEVEGMVDPFVRAVNIDHPNVPFTGYMRGFEQCRQSILKKLKGE